MTEPNGTIAHDSTPPRVFVRTSNSVVELFLVSVLAASCLAFSWLMFIYDVPNFFYLSPIILGGPFLVFWARSDIKKLVVRDDFVEIHYHAWTRKISYADITEVRLEQWEYNFPLMVVLALRDGKKIATRFSDDEKNRVLFTALDAAIKAKGVATPGDLNAAPETSVTRIMIRLMYVAMLLWPLLLFYMKYFPP